jgi:acyl-CoA synthetase (AMP-forming)/AMP-acid ligase II
MSVAMYGSMLAVQRLGAISVFLDSWARRDHLGATAACVEPKGMISHRAAFELVRDLPEFADMRIHVIGGPGHDGTFAARVEELMATTATAPVAPVESEHTALITFTTGSSGTPKGANRTHRFLAAQHRALARVIPYEPGDRDLPAFPIFSLNNLASGVTTILPALNLAQPSARDGALLVCQLLHENITCTTLSPSMLNGVSRFCLDQGIELPALRRVVTGGAPISRDDVRDFARIAPNAEIWVLYGSTEVEPMAHIEAQEMLAVPMPSDPEIVEEGVNVGHIDESLEYKFLRIVRGDIDLARTPWSELEVPTGEVGEFVVTGDHVCRDYWNNQDAVRVTKIIDEHGRVWHRTGDLAYRDALGHLWIVGRVHNAVERGGRYYFPVRAEVLLKRVPGVRQGAFLGLADPHLGERNTVAIELSQGSAGSAAAATAAAEVRRLFAKNGIPIDELHVVGHIPMDPRHHSKVEYGALRERLAG